MTSQRSPISVFIANPHSMARELLIEALKRYKHFRVVDSAITAQAVLDAVRTANPDVLLLTATLADGPLSGFGVLRQIRESSPEVKTVILLNGPERNLVVDAFRAGAKGVFVMSSSNFKSLRRCVEQVNAGQIWATSAELSEVMEAFAQLAPMRVVNADGMNLLTRREEEVVRLLAEGMQNRDIAKQLKLSEHTVKNYLFHIFDKLGVSSRVELVLYAVSSTKRQPTVAAKSDQKEVVPAEGASTTAAVGSNSHSNSPSRRTDARRAGSNGLGSSVSLNQQ